MADYRLIDCDVHNALPDDGALAPYMPREWRDRREALTYLPTEFRNVRENLGDRSYIGAEYPRPTPRASRVDASPVWPDTVRAAAAWFEGANDAGLPMWDRQTGGGFDGLHSNAVNQNQGAESTLAVLSTLQHAQRLSPVLQ